MRKRGWIVPQLSEFYPESPNLLVWHSWSYFVEKISLVVPDVDPPAAGHKHWWWWRPHTDDQGSAEKALQQK
jgi:hypothetical protein